MSMSSIKLNAFNSPDTVLQHEVRVGLLSDWFLQLRVVRGVQAGARPGVSLGVSLRQEDAG